MNKKEAQELTNEMMLADALLRLRSLEKLLIAKGVFTQEEFSQEMDVLAKQIAKSLLEKAHVKGNIDELIESLQKSNKTPSNGN